MDQNSNSIRFACPHQPDKQLQNLLSGGSCLHVQVAYREARNLDFCSDLGFKLGVMKLNLGFPVVFDQKEGYGLKFVVFFAPFWGASWRPKSVFMLQDALKNPPGRVQEEFFLETKFELNIEGS